ncbi:DUF262 domain-containing protein [Skermania piniformis]|uniref:DUF262 domain-containing HNH endonuclease family protein n=1 Tax=Skermania pinensis TaxID=39122 RepID=A0ABX8S8V3_9ACTN|nr:DUF262 domain-containing protein [Skermania piniformis]QXQ13427.1 DUF262 domain-containing HNH endonuclease family protein [Skermania piniformis]
MTTKTLDAHEQPLRKVFSSDYSFTIPDYQRPYRWGTEEAIHLLDDLEEALERSSDEPYFLGSLVLIRRSGTEFDVVDGQQRLTTLTILFAVLRDLAASTDDAQTLTNTVLEPGDSIDDIPPKPRLRLRKQDASFFERNVQTYGNVEHLAGLSNNVALSEPQQRMRDNARSLLTRLRAWSDARRKQLARLLRTQTFLVVVSTPDLNSAYRIFSVMNARGLDLTPADIFKSKVIGALGDNDDYAKQWENAEESLGSSDFTELFRDIRTIVNGDRARRELLKEFPDQVLNAYLDSPQPERFIDDLLLPYALAFERTIERDFKGTQWAPVNDWLKRLSMIDNKDWRPAALWALKHHADDPAFLTEFLGKLERLAATFLLRREYTTPRITRYLDLLRDLKNGQGLAANAFVLTDQEKDESREAVGGEVYRMQAERARYVLLRLDDLLTKGSGATYDHSVISIEHVLPQNPAAGSEWETLFTAEQRKEWTHRLGNLLLLNRRKNSQARNYDFTKKKSRYFTTSDGSAVFALTTQVVGYDQWTPEAVTARQTELTKLLIDEWKLN